MKDINGMFLLYKNIYNLENINIKGIQDNTINFLFFDAELNFYTICDKSILSYRFDSGIIEIITNIEEMYKMICENGYEVITDGIEQLPFWDNGVKFFMIKGPNEERIEFCQKL